MSFSASSSCALNQRYSSPTSVGKDRVGWYGSRGLAYHVGGDERGETVQLEGTISMLAKTGELADRPENLLEHRVTVKAELVLCRSISCCAPDAR
jgi:hypothetical protein